LLATGLAGAFEQKLMAVYANKRIVLELVELSASGRPQPAGRDWLLYGDEYG